MTSLIEQVLPPDLPAALESYLRKQEDDWGDHLIHVSDLGHTLPFPDGKCPRQLWLRLQGAPRRQDKFGELLMFDNGNRLHETVVEYVRHNLPEGWSILLVEAPVAEQLLYIQKGSTDVVLSGPNDELVVVDAKTVRGRALQYGDLPYATHQLQVQTYVKAMNAALGLLLYLDREGQNGARQVIVPRDDVAVVRATVKLKRIVESPEPPPMFPVKVDVKENKGPDSVKVSLPWQCERCAYRPLSCPGPIHPDQLPKGVCGHVDDEGEFTPKEGVTDEVADIIERYIREEGVGGGADAQGDEERADEDSKVACSEDQDDSAGSTGLSVSEA